MKTLDLLKPIIYIITGLLIIIFFKDIVDILPYVVGSIMIIVNLEAIIVDILEKDYGHIGYKIGILILGILLMTILAHDFEAICVVWATISIVNGGRSLVKSGIEIKESWLNIVGLLLAITSIVLSIFLFMNPLEHVSSHIILLGIEIILDGLRIIIRKYKLKYKNSVNE